MSKSESESDFPKRIVVVGASSCEGKVDPEHGGFVGRLRRWSESLDSHHHVYNLGISGNTTQDIIDRIKVEVPQRQPDLLILMLGTNDIRREGSPDGPTENDIDAISQNLATLFTSSKSLCQQLLMVSIYPNDESRTSPVSWRNIHYLFDDASQLAQLMKQAAEDWNIAYIDIFNQWLTMSDYHQLLSQDGLHASAKGHQHIFEQIKKYLETNYEI